MPLIWTCCHCGKSTRMPEVLDGMQGRCPHCRRNSMVQGPHIADDEESQTGLRAIAPESAVDHVADDRVQFPMKDIEYE